MLSSPVVGLLKLTLRHRDLLCSAENSQQELVSTSTDMRDSLQKLKANLDPLASAAKLKEELASLKLSALFCSRPLRDIKLTMPSSRQQPCAQRA